MTVFSEHYAHARCSVLNYEVLMCISAERTVSHSSVRWKKETRNVESCYFLYAFCVSKYARKYMQIEMILLSQSSSNIVLDVFIWNLFNIIIYSRLIIDVQNSSTVIEILYALLIESTKKLERKLKFTMFHATRI